METDSKIRLYAEMARCMALDRNRYLDPQDVLPAGTVLHGGMVSAIEGSDRVFEALRLADENGVLLVATSDFEKILSGTSILEMPFSDQFEAFIWISASQCGDLPTVREWFRPAEHYIPVMNAFCDCGYASERQAKYLWLDSLESPMLQAGFWNEDSENNASIRRAETQAEVAHLLRTMPSSVRGVLTDPDVIDNILRFGERLVAYRDIEINSWRTEPVQPKWWQYSHYNEVEPILRDALRKDTQVWRRR